MHNDRLAPYVDQLRIIREGLHQIAGRMDDLNEDGQLDGCIREQRLLLQRVNFTVEFMAGEAGILNTEVGAPGAPAMPGPTMSPMAMGNPGAEVDEEELSDGLVNGGNVFEQVRSLGGTQRQA